MPLTINLAPAKMEEVQAQARACGKDVDAFVVEAIDEKLARRKRTLAEVLKPIHEAVKASGLHEADVDVLLEQELKALRAEKRSSSAKA